MDFDNKRILVLGLGRSGLSAARILKKSGCKVWVSDSGKTPKIEEQASFLEREGIIVETGGHSDQFIDSKDLIVISPGINSKLPVLNKARKNGVPVISEIELGFLLCPAPIIAVTGTNGKTTVTTLIGMVIEKAGRHAVVCGNIGNSFTGEIEKIRKDDFVVLEVSSFQLENISKFKPHIAVVLNITPDHLDRYASVEDYTRAKEKIFINQDNSDYTVLNFRDNVVNNFKNKTKAKTVYFNTDCGSENDLNENQKAVFTTAKLLGISDEVIFSVFRDFKGAEHRYEFVAKINGITFINDSKATNIDSTIWGLNLSKDKVILIAGGRDKGQNFLPMRKWLKDKVKLLLLIGEGADNIEKSADNCIPIKRMISLEEATKYAFDKAEPPDIVLLSPMCSSFDMFDNYEHRGKVFKKAVLNLTEIRSKCRI